MSVLLLLRSHTIVTVSSSVSAIGTVQTPVPIDLPTPAQVAAIGTVPTPVGVFVALPTQVSAIGTVQTATAIGIATVSVVSAIATVQVPNPMAAQRVIPDGIIFGGGWKNEAGSSINIQTSIDEFTADDADYITIAIG